MTPGTIACPNCGRPIARSESNCAWCGAKRPSALRRAFSRGGQNGDTLIKAIIAANVAFFALSLVLSSHRGFDGNPMSFLAPDKTSLLLLGATGTVPVLKLGRFWTLISANYLHGGLLHIFFNMLALRQIGPWVSAEFGPSRMFVIYTLSGVLGYLVSCLAGIPLTIGASGSVCGLIGALFFFGKSRGGSYGTAVSREVSGWLISLFLFGFVLPGINNWAHGGGIVGGIVLAKLLDYRERRWETPLQIAVASLCGVATAVVLLWSLIVALALVRSG